MPTPRLLLVDDDPDFVMLAEAALDGLEVEVRTLTDPATVADEVRSFRPDLLILDYYMPGQNGLEVYADLLDQSAGNVERIAVWMCSRVSEAGLVASAYGLGIADYLTKPIQPPVLRAKVAAFLRRLAATAAAAVPAPDREVLESVKRGKASVQSMLRTPPPVPGLSTGLIYEPHSDVGGDFYDFIVPPAGTDGASLIIVGDVVGHGVEAALVQTMARKLIQVRLADTGDTVHALRQINADLKAELPPAMFVAALVAEWYPAHATLRIYRMGVPHPVVRKPGQPSSLVICGGTPFGLHRDQSFVRTINPIDVVLKPGDTILLHTDGLIENPVNDAEFGFEGLQKLLDGYDHTLTPQQAVQRLRDDTLHAAGSRTFEDDLTLVALQATAPAV